MSKNLNLIKVAKELSLSNDEVSLDLSGDLSVSGILDSSILGDTVLMPDNSNNVSTAPGIRFEADTDTGIGLVSAGNLAVVTGGSERMRIDSSGNLLIGTTSATPVSSNVNGVAINNSGQWFSTATSAPTAYYNRKTSDGDIVQFRKNGATVGSIGSSTSISGNLFIAGDSGLQFRSTDILPTNSSGSYTDGVLDLGDVSARFEDVYATNAIIQTSDRNEKQDIEELSNAETRVAQAAKGLLRKFRWKSAVAKKGDGARIHFGIIAQDLKVAFEAEGLDAGRYGMFIHSEWWETEETYTDDDGAEKTRINTFDTEEEAPEGAIKRDTMGIRYSELLAFIIAAI